MNINCEHLKDFDADLYRQLINYPQEVVPTFDMAINEMFFDKYPAAILEHQIQMRPYNAEMTRNMRSLNPGGRTKWLQYWGLLLCSSKGEAYRTSTPIYFVLFRNTFALFIDLLIFFFV